jgi:hypothetical protein
VCCAACDPAVGGQLGNDKPDARVTLDAAPDADIDAPIDAPGTITLSQTNSQMLVKNASVGCANSGGYTEENEWYRVFDLASYGIVDTFHVEQVTFAVDTSVGNKTVNVKIGRYEAALTNPLETGNSDFAGAITLLQTTSVAVPPTNTGVVMTAELDMYVLPNTKLIVEVQSPQGGYFFLGATNTGETATGYLRAPACGRGKPVTVATLGFPNAHLLLSVTGTK